jgi:hypothetical protein
MSVSSLSTTSSAVRGATAAGATDWLADTTARIKASENQGGLLGMLSAAAQGNNDGSTKSFMTNSITASNMFATIAQSTVTSYSSLIAQMASARQQKAQAQKLEDAMKSLQDTQNMVAKKNVLDTFIYMPDGSYIDTANSIMTMSDGTQYDVTTGAKYVDPTMIIQMANGSYLDTKNNILTMADGSRIDSVTGIRLSTTV